MSGELHLIKELLAELDDSVDKQLNPQYAEDLLFTELLTRLGKRRKADDILQQAQFHLENLDEDEFVVTRGC